MNLNLRIAAAATCPSCAVLYDRGAQKQTHNKTHAVMPCE